jgi:uncharacterized protein YpmB
MSVNNGMKRFFYLIVMLIIAVLINLAALFFTEKEEPLKKDKAEVLQFHNIIITED